VSDTGYTPDNWVPTKVTVGAAGVVVAVAVVLWSRRRRFLAVGLVVAFTALTTAWFLLDV
jgi:multisubunit Na+/H+ antiporter MnhG subunit